MNWCKPCSPIIRRHRWPVGNEQPTTLRNALTHTTATLCRAGCDTPALDARLLLQAATGYDHAALIVAMHDSLPPAAQQTLEELVTRRKHREPIAYILGYRDFWKQRLRCDARALIPRPETELLIEEVLARIPDRNAPLHLCDIATGSGCLAIALALEYPNARITASDLSKAALALARENAELHGVTQRIDFQLGDLFNALPKPCPRFDVVVSNPPYVSRTEMDTLAPELAFEPRMALTEERDGLTILRRLVTEAPTYLNPNGLLIVETGLCGLPEPEIGTPLTLTDRIFDLAGLLRGGVYLHTP